MTAGSKNNVMITRWQALALTGGALVASSVVARGASADLVPGTSVQAGPGHRGHAQALPDPDALVPVPFAPTASRVTQQTRMAQTSA